MRRQTGESGCVAQGGIVTILVTDLTSAKSELLRMSAAAGLEGLDPALTAVIRIGHRHAKEVSLPAGLRGRELCLAVRLLGQKLVLKRKLVVREKRLKTAATLAYRDPLTGLLNRRAWATFAAQKCHEAAGHGFALLVALFDLDRFKEINDRLGHAAGDELLKTIASRACRACREGDMLIRWGGDELLFVAVISEPSAAQAVVERIRRQLCNDSGVNSSRVTASSGYLVLHPIPSWSQAVAEKWIAALDTALRQAKASGGNCSVAAPTVAKTP